MKKLVKTFFAALLAFTMTACASDEKDEAAEVKTGTNSTYAYLLDTTDLNKPELDLSNATGKLKSVLDAGVLVIATSPDFPPGQFMSEDGTQVLGSEMMFAKYIADVLGVDLQIETMDFSAVLTAVSTGKVDLALSGFGYKKDRAENFEISYGYSGTDEASCHGLLVYEETVDDYETLEDFSGKHILAQASSLQQMYVEDEIPDADLELVSTLDQAILNMTSGKADAVALPCTTAERYAANSDGLLAKSTVEFDLTPYEDYAGTVMCAAKGETEFMDVLNQIITTVNENQYYTDWYNVAKEQAGIED